MKNVYVFLANGFEEIEALTIVDVLRRGEIPTYTISITDRKEVVGAHNISVMADLLFDEKNLNDSEMLILPGGMPGASNLLNHSGLTTLLKNAEAQKGNIAAICAAPMVLGSLDILKGKNAVCYPGFEDKLKGAKILYDPVCNDQNVITGRGPGAAIQFALEIMNKLKGKNVADDLAGKMLVTKWY